MRQDNNTQILRPALYAEKLLIRNIINGKWKPGDKLPSERILSAQLNITRQTLRETLKSLATEGWITIQHGRPTVVNDYLNTGSLGILKTLIKHCELITKPVIRDWLQFRTILLPEIAQIAANKDKQKILDLLEAKPADSDPAEVFARYDWELQELLVKLSNNTIVKMIFNDIREAYQKLAKKYFSNTQGRNSSIAYYLALEQELRKQNPDIKPIVKAAMQQSLANFITLFDQDTDLQ